MLKLNLGCGSDYLKDFVNIDLNCKADYQINLLDPLPFEKESVDEVLASHIFEHFGYAELPILIKDIHRVLKKGGLLTVRVPDIVKSISNFLLNSDGRRWKWWIKEIYGGQWNAGEFHKNGFDEERLVGIMKEFGFSVDTVLPPRDNTANTTELNIIFKKN